jgi:hypothetical protein
MTTAIYITDPAVATHYHVSPGEWATVDDDAEAQWLFDNFHAYHADVAQTLPAAYFVHPDAPNPFVPYAGPAPAPSPSPAPEPSPPPAPEPPPPPAPRRA